MRARRRLVRGPDRVSNCPNLALPARLLGNGSATALSRSCPTIFVNGRQAHSRQPVDSEPIRRWRRFTRKFTRKTNRNAKMAIRDRSSLRAFVLCLTATGAALGVSVVAARAADPSGLWMVADQTARIRIEPCADGYWGSIDWERTPGIDSKNPDPARRGKPLLGAPILLSMKPADNEWDGKVYNPKDGGYYSASIKLQNPNALRLEGCMLIFCSGETWTRVPDPARATTGTGAAPQAHARSVCPQQAGGPAQTQRR
jgi:uncharacterized protein (DUF2147 family)